MAALFDKIDTSGSGTITKAQFEQAFQKGNPPKGFQQAGADAIWAKLDPKGTGSISKQDFVSSMTTLMSQVRHGHHHHAGSSQNASAPTATINASLGALNALGSSEGGSSAAGNSINTTA
ncbi:MAG: EF-hand domain-containing protein [Proteobacteria bacterium]|nr:EF-hand domain-containing protein [Pseudomonadota bacterium]